MRVLGFLMLPINPLFMSKYITTIGSTIYIPDVDIDVDEDTTVKWISIVGHEYVHTVQGENNALFRILYLMPQVLGFFGLAVMSFFHCSILPFFLAGYLTVCLVAAVTQNIAVRTFSIVSVALAVATGWVLLLQHQPIWFWIFVGISLLLLAPLPAPFRSKYELEAYSTSILIYEWIRGTVVDPAVVEKFKTYFKGPGYYYMGWHLSDTGYKPLYDAASREGALTPPTEPPLSTIYSCLVNLGYLHNPQSR